MSRAAGAPVHVLTDAQLGDLEAVLAGILPSGTHLGAPFGDAAMPGTDLADGGTGAPSGSVGAPSGSGGVPSGSVTVEKPVAEAAASVGTLLLVDEESTPLATLGVVSVQGDTGSVQGDAGDAVVITGALTRGRHRESGSGRVPRLGSDPAEDRAEAPDHVIVLARPVLGPDLPALNALAATDKGSLVVVVPDSPAATDGVPTQVMISLAEGLARRLERAGARAEVRLAPLRWRGADSDRTLLGGLAAYLGGEVSTTLLHADADLDPSAPEWARVRCDLEAATDDGPISGLDPDSEHALRRWRRPRPERGVALMFSGFSGSGKSTLARAFVDELAARSERTVSLLDGDVVRQMLSAGLGFDRSSRIMNVRRIGYVAAEVVRHGGIAVCAPIAPYAETRADVRRMVEAVGDFVLVHVSTPLAECERRDLKGLYAAARAGKIPEFTGISDPYDVPTDADLSIDTTDTSVTDGVEQVITFLTRGGWLVPAGPPQPSG